MYMSGYTDDERKAYVSVIASNAIQSMKVMIHATDMLDIVIDEQYEQDCVHIEEVDDVVSWTVNLTRAIGRLWRDPGIQEAYRRSNEFQLNDSAGYYFDSIDRISSPNYVPTDQDILRSRVRTTGIVETTFSAFNFKFNLIDVGGQRNERKKWMHCFQDVTAIMFLVAISEYDQMLFEDESVNRIHESLTLFSEVINSAWFRKTHMILFLNKSDIFAQKIHYADLRFAFPDYAGKPDFEEAVQFIAQKFKELNKVPGKQVYPHLTNATDTNNVRFVFQAVKDILERENLEALGLHDGM